MGIHNLKHLKEQCVEVIVSKCLKCSFSILKTFLPINYGIEQLTKGCVHDPSPEKYLTDMAGVMSGFLPHR